MICNCLAVCSVMQANVALASYLGALSKSDFFPLGFWALEMRKKYNSTVQTLRISRIRPACIVDTATRCID